MNITINDKINSYTFEITNKTLIYTNEDISIPTNLIKQAFEGKIYLQINGIDYKKSDYSIFWFDENFNLKDSEKFTAKSIEYQTLQKYIEFNDFEHNINELSTNLKNLITQFSPHIKLDNKKLSTLDLIPSLFKLSINNHEINPNIFRLFLLLDLIKNSTKPTFVFFEKLSTNNNNDYNQLLKIIFEQQTNINFVILTNKIQTLTYVTNNLTIYQNQHFNQHQILNRFRDAYLIYKLKITLDQIFDYYNYYKIEELRTQQQKYLTLDAWNNFFFKQKLTTFQEIFFTLLANKDLVTNGEYKELVWVDEH